MSRPKAAVPLPPPRGTNIRTVPIGTYSAYIGRDLLRHIPSHIITLVKAPRYILVTDQHLYQHYGAKLEQAFKQLSLELHTTVIPPGEASKSRETKARIEDWMLSKNCGRDTCMIALGGGVIGDLTGYIAATYMRGIPVCHIPTSLLAMVDSSIGGKTGIDTPAGKNLLGAFHRPKAVYIDVDLLQTLPIRELCNGMAEALKAGAIYEESLFALIESSAERVLRKDADVLTEIIYRSVRIKGDVVVKDEREGGLRAILNFGHTIGHAIEALMQPTLLHGECVAIGMIEEALLARARGYVGVAAIRRLETCIRAYKLPTKIPPHLTIQALLEKMAVDKKNKDSKKEFIMLTSIGSVRSNPYTTTVEDEELIKLMSSGIVVIPGRAQGTITVPGSKSLSNRVLLMAAMGVGTCRIRGLLHSQDTQVMLESLRRLGVKFEWEEQQTILVMYGVGGKLHVPNEPLFLNNAGTAARFLTTLVNIVPHGTIELTGNERMQQRPIGDLVDALIRAGSQMEYVKKPGCLPIKVTGTGGLRGGDIILAANTSSQYVSSILLAAPSACTPVTLKLDLTKGRVVSAPYIAMTIKLMSQFGVRVEDLGSYTYRIQNGTYRNPSDFLVEGDASSATYPLALAAITGGTVTVDNVGSDSTQGDAQFCRALQQMGCQVSQTEMTTTVTGPAVASSLRGIPSIDMDSMTDSFMTLAAVAALATGTTRITHIANQRVKECDRIAVMTTELIRCGFTVREQKDGIEIDGWGDQPFPQTYPIIACHDDHRIAMSFAVLGSRLPNILISEKRCVDKTYPEFWEHIERFLGIKSIPPSHPTIAIQHAGLQQQSITTSDKITLDILKQATIIITGMRGAGKTSLGRALSRHVSRPFVDVDHVIEKRVGSIKQYITKTSWSAFRAIELEVFRELITSHPTGWIISCGGGIIETSAAADLLSKHPIVIQVHRHINDIVKYLDQDTTRPTFDARAVYDQRRSLYTSTSHYSFIVPERDNDIKLMEQAFLRIMDVIMGRQRPHLARNTFFLSLTYPDIRTAIPHLSNITRGVDAVELRVDLLKSWDTEYVSEQIYLLRKYTHLPIIFTVRTKEQGGAFPDDHSAAFTLLHLGIRLGCDYIDMETHVNTELKHSLLQHRRHARIIGSHHIPHGNGGTDDDLRQHFIRIAQDGYVDVVKLVIMAKHESDATRLIGVANSIQLPGAPLIISLAMGSRGKLSRVLNSVLTPVTHSLLPSAAAPGQMSVVDIQKTRTALGLLPPRRYAIIGTPVYASPSPLLHNTGFEWYHLPHTYDRLDTSDIERVASFIRDPHFGGASITIPLKEKVVTLMHELSPAAKAIGAVNTIIRLENDSLGGDNTDWLGIYNPLSHHLCPGSIPSTSYAIIIGAGGTARAAIYACQQLGFISKNIILSNRSHQRAVELAHEFRITSLETSLTKQNLPKGGRLELIISTIPGANSAVVIDDSLFQDKHKPVVFDVSYLPAKTALIIQAIQHGAPFIRGIDMLIAQGVEQFALWTGHVSSAPIQESAVRRMYAEKYEHQSPAEALVALSKL